MISAQEWMHIRFNYAHIISFRSEQEERLHRPKKGTTARRRRSRGKHIIHVDRVGYGYFKSVNEINLYCANEKYFSECFKVNDRIIESTFCPWVSDSLLFPLALHHFLLSSAFILFVFSSFEAHFLSLLIH